MLLIKETKLSQNQNDKSLFIRKSPMTSKMVKFTVNLKE